MKADLLFRNRLYISAILFIGYCIYHNGRDPYLLGELLFTQLVQSEELASQCDVFQEATRGQLHPNDDLAVGHHHGHIAELYFEVLRQHLTAVVAQVLVQQHPRWQEEVEAMARVKDGSGR